MLHLEGDEVDSDSDNSDKNSESNKEETKPNHKKSEEQIINNKKINKVNSKKIAVSESDNFFKGDSNNYDIMGMNKMSSKKINNNNSLNNNKENSENENSEDDLNFTPVDEDKDNFSYHKENEKEEEKEEINNKNVENSLENINKLQNKDNNNNNDSNNTSKKNKDNNSESSEENHINNPLNNKNKNMNNNINNISKKKNDDSSDSSEYSNKKYTNEHSKEKNNASSSSEDSNSHPNQNLNNQNEEENIINNNNKSIQFEIKENPENNNINNKKNTIKSSEEEEDEEEEKKDNNSMNNKNANNKSINQNNNHKNENNLENDEDDNLNKIKINNKKTVLKFSKNEISSIKDNNSSINKEQNSEEDSFSLNSNSEKKKKKQDDDNTNNINLKNADSSEQSQKQINNKNNNNENEMIKILKKMESSNINEMKKSANKNKKSIHLNEIIFIKDEHYINYIKLKRKGFKNILDKNYVNGYSIFSECYELSSQHLKDKIKQIDSLINMSICQYYNGNFYSGVTLLFNAKKLFTTISLGECHISLRDKIRLGIKLFTNSSMSNLTYNNYKESINDIKYIIDLLEQENNLMKKLELYKYTVYSLFKVETLVNIKNENEIINNIKNNFNYNSSDKNLKDLNGINNNKEINDIYIDNQNEKIMNDFLSCLKYKNFLIILNSFIENATMYKKNKKMIQYYFCIFNQYLISYNNTINTQENNEENIKEIKERLFICYKNLVGEEIASKIKEKKKNKNIIQFLNEFVKKMECAFEIFSLLENYEKSLNNITQDLYKEKKDNKLIDKKKFKNKFKLNEESPYLVKLCLKYSLNYLTKKRDFLANNTNNKNNDSEINDNSPETINNLNSLIKELEILIKKIDSYEIDISSIRKNKINQDIINNIKILFKNLSNIYHKSRLYLTFHKFREKILKIKLNEIYLNIDNFLDKNYEKIMKGMTLMKINYSSKGHKYYYYNIDSDSNTLQIRQKEGDPYPSMSYNLIKDVTKITYGIRTKNLVKKLKNKNECLDETRKFLRMPWRFISFVLQKKSIDLCLENDQVDTWFYGLKSFTKNDVEYKIISTNKFLLNKIKYRIAIQLKCAVDNGEIVEEKSINLVKKIIKEKAFHAITFTKLILLYNKLIKDK